MRARTVTRSSGLLGSVRRIAVIVSMSCAALASCAGESSTSTSSVPVASRDFAPISPILDRYISEHDLNGAGLLIVDKDDGVVYERYWGDFSADRVSLIASASKMISAGVLLHLDDEGLLDIDAPVPDVVEWGTSNSAITPAQLLSNSSGLVGVLPELEYPPYLCMWEFEGTLEDCARHIFTTPDDDADVVPPDTEFRYGGGQWQVAGAVAEIASGKSWAELIDDIFVTPCDVPSLGYNNHYRQIGEIGPVYPPGFDGPASLRPTSNPHIEGGAYITPRDYATLLLMNLRDGYCGDERVLSTEALARMHEDHTTVYPGATQSPTGYGMGWWIDHETGRLTDPGAYGTTPWLDLEDGYGAYLVVEATNAMGNELAAELYAPVEEAMTAAQG